MTRSPSYLWQNRYGYSFRAGDRWKDFHAFRKTFASYVYYMDVPKDRIKQVIGHSTGNDILTRHNLEKIFKGKSLLEKAEVHKRIDLSPLKKSDYVIKK